MGTLGFFAILRVFCIGVALLPVGQYALCSRYCPTGNTRSWRGYVLTFVARIRRAWLLPLTPSPSGRGN